MMNILIAGDIVPKEENMELFANGDINKILGKKLEDIWNSANYRVFNLESPITSYSKKLKKTGPNFKINPRVAKGLVKLNPSLILLANNHILDYGIDGLNETIKILKENKLNYIGVGENVYNQKSSYIIKAEDKNIAIYNCCDTEFSIATISSAGANPYNPLKIQNEIENLKKKNDYVIVLFHGGKECYRYPTPHLQEICRYMVNFGADLVICQHSHCIGCYEDYKNSKIIYGQGNFIFSDYPNECGDTSLLIDIDISNNFKINYIPIFKTLIGTSLAEEEVSKKVLKDFEERSLQIMENGFIEEKYNQIIGNSFDIYLKNCHGGNLIYKVINKLFKYRLTKLSYSEKSLLSLLNVVECEAHREILISCLKNRIYHKNK